MQDAQYRIKELIQMKDSGEINQSEFDQLKASALNSQQGSEPPVKKPRSDETGLDLEEGVELQCNSNESYRLIKKIGKGGMGQVWQVEDLNESAAFNETVYKAIKVLPLELAQSITHLDLLRKEAALTARLSHDNIINVFGLREGQAKNSHSQGKIPFLLMEHLQGQDLEQLIEAEKPLNWVQAEPWLTNIAAALDNAWNTQGLIHRDLKPGNIFLTDTKQIKLLDFGLAWRIRKSQLSLSSQQIDDSSSRGTVAYMPPEAFANTAPDPRQDVYALACVCYEMLTGKTPYEPEAAKQRDPRLYPDTPQQLNKTAWEILKQGFAYKKAQRPKTAGELIEKLKVAQKKKKAEPSKVSPKPEAPIPPKTNSADKQRVKSNIWMIGIIVCLCGLGAYAVSVYNKSQLQLQSSIAEYSKLVVINADIFIKKKEYESAYGILTLGLKKDPENIKILFKYAFVAIKLGNFSVAERSYKSILKIESNAERSYRSILKIESNNAPRALNALGYMLVDKTTRYDEARVYIEKALAIKKKANYVDSYGWLFFKLGEYDKAMLHLERAYKAYPVPEIAGHLVELFIALGKNNEAETLLKAALEKNKSNAYLLGLKTKLL